MRLTIFCIIVCTCLPCLYAAQNSKTGEKIKSYLDKKQAACLYLDSRFPCKTSAKNKELREDVEAFRAEFLGNEELTKKDRVRTSKQLIVTLANLGKNKEALDLCRDFSDRYPGDKKDTASLYCFTGEYFQKIQRYAAAMEAYQQALSCSGNSALTSYIYIGLGWCYYANAEYYEAAEQYSCALRGGFLNPEALQWTWFETGRCCFFLRDYEGAAEAFRQAISVNPGTELGRQAGTNIEDIEKLRNGGT